MSLRLPGHTSLICRSDCRGIQISLSLICRSDSRGIQISPSLICRSDSQGIQISLSLICRSDSRGILRWYVAPTPAAYKSPLRWYVAPTPGAYKSPFRWYVAPTPGAYKCSSRGKQMIAVILIRLCANRNNVITDDYWKKHGISPQFVPRSWRGILDTTLCDNVCQWLAAGRWFSPGIPISSTNKADHHDIAEILLKVALSTINQTKPNFISSWASLLVIRISFKDISSVKF